MNSKLHVSLALIAVLALCLSSGVAARYLAETLKEQIDVKETTAIEKNSGKVYRIIHGRGPTIPCARGKKYSSCIPGRGPPPKGPCNPYERHCPPSSGEVMKTKP